jgi:AcrR family transcriptional regulator
MVRLSRQESRRVTRQRLARSVERELIYRGVSGMAVDRISREAGYSRGAFYANFEDWADLLTDLLKDRQEREIQSWNAIFEEGGDFDEALLRVIGLSQESVTGTAVVRAELLLEAQRNDKFRPHYEAYLEAVYLRVEELFETILRRRGKGRPEDLRARVIAIYATGSWLGLRSSGGAMPMSEEQQGALLKTMVADIICSAPPLAGGSGAAGTP